MKTSRKQQRLPCRTGLVSHGEELERRLLLSATTGRDNDVVGLAAKMPQPAGPRETISGQYVLRMRANGQGTSRFDYRHAAPAVPAGWASSEIGFGFYRVTAPGVSLQQVRAWGLRAGVLYVEPATRVKLSVAPNDPEYRAPADGLWGLKKIGLEGAWAHGRGSADVVIAVIDSGIDTTHPDLQPNLWRNVGEVAGNGIDDDGNGYVDDVHGWHAFLGNGDVTDKVGHGTHVAGTIGAVGNNGIGVVGVGWNLKLMPVNLDNGFGGLGNVEEAISYVIRQKLSGVNVAAINGSFGSYTFRQSYYDLIKLAGDTGILWVGSAGNDASNNDAIPHYPDGYALPNVISVASSTNTAGDRLTLFSNYGRRSVHVAAPGDGVLSTVPGGGYQVFSGTSMAAPHVTGVVGLLKSIYPTASAGQIRAAILGSVDKSSLLDGSVLPFDQLATGGRLNAARAVEFLRRGANPPAVRNPPPFGGVPDVGVTGGAIAEGHSGLRGLTFTITVSQATATGTRVRYETIDGTAVAGRDYVRATGVAFVRPNQTSATVTVMVRGNRVVDRNRSFELHLTNPVNGRIAAGRAAGTIFDDDGPGGVSLQQASIQAAFAAVGSASATHGGQSATRPKARIRV